MLMGGGVSYGELPIRQQKENLTWKVVQSADRCGLFGVDSSTQQRGFPAVHIILGVTGQLQGAIVLVDIPKHHNTGHHMWVEATEELDLYKNVMVSTKYTGIY